MSGDVHMHHIQKSIILNLARTSPLRFTELQPPRIPNNTFSYHLKKLVDGGYIEPTEAGYLPTRKALKLVVFGVNSRKPAPSPDIVTMLYVENHEGETLLLNRNHKPFQGWYGIPRGLVRLGESLDEAARRELSEKTTIVAEGELQSMGILEFRYIEQETQDIFLHMIGFVYKYVFDGNKQELSDKVTRYGQLAWSKLERSNLLLPEVYTIRDMAHAAKPLHLSMSFEEPAQLPTFTDEINLDDSDTSYTPIITSIG